MSSENERDNIVNDLDNTTQNEPSYQDSDPSHDQCGNHEVFHFGTVDKLRLHLDRNMPGFIASSSSALSNADRCSMSKEIIEHILDEFPSLT